MVAGAGAAIAAPAAPGRPPQSTARQHGRCAYDDRHNQRFNKPHAQPVPHPQRLPTW